MLNLIKTTRSVSMAGDAISRVNLTHVMNAIVARYACSDATFISPANVKHMKTILDLVTADDAHTKAIELVVRMEQHVGAVAAAGFASDKMATPLELAPYANIAYAASAGHLTVRELRLSMMAQIAEHPNAKAYPQLIAESVIELRNLLMSGVSSENASDPKGPGLLDPCFSVSRDSNYPGVHPTGPTYGGTYARMLVHDTTYCTDFFGAALPLVGKGDAKKEPQRVAQRSVVSKMSDGLRAFAAMDTVMTLELGGRLCTSAYVEPEALLGRYLAEGAAKDKHLIAVARVFRFIHLISAMTIPRLLFAVRVLEKTLATPSIKALWEEDITQEAKRQWEEDTKVLEGLRLPAHYNLALRFLNPSPFASPWGDTTRTLVADTLYDELISGEPIASGTAAERASEVRAQESAFSELALTRHAARRLKVSQLFTRREFSQFAGLLEARRQLARLLAPGVDSRQNLVRTAYEELASIGAFTASPGDAACPVKDTRETVFVSDGAFSNVAVRDTFDNLLLRSAPVGVVSGNPALLAFTEQGTVPGGRIGDVGIKDLVTVDRSSRGEGNIKMDWCHWMTPVLWSTNWQSRAHRPLGLVVDPTDYELEKRVIGGNEVDAQDVVLHTGGIVGSMDYLSMENTLQQWSYVLGIPVSEVLTSVITQRGLWRHLFDEEGAPLGSRVMTSTATRARQRNCVAYLPPVAQGTVILSDRGHIVEAWNPTNKMSGDLYARTPQTPELPFSTEMAANADIGLLGVKMTDWAKAPASEGQL